MDQDSFYGLQEQDERFSRRGVFKKAGLMGLGILGTSNLVKSWVPAVRAEETRNVLHRVERTGAQGRRRTVNELMAILQTHPGGLQAIEAARRGGAKFSFGSNPPQLQESNPPVGPFSLLLSPGKFQVGQSWAELRDVDFLADSTIKINRIGLGANAIFHIDFPKKGWYLLNIEGVTKPGWSISAKLIRGISAPSAPIQTWSYPASNQIANRSFPAVFNYQSFKELWLYVESGAFLFLDFSVESL